MQIQRVQHVTALRHLQSHAGKQPAGKKPLKSMPPTSSLKFTGGGDGAKTKELATSWQEDVKKEEDFNFSTTDTSEYIILSLWISLIDCLDLTIDNLCSIFQQAQHVKALRLLL